MRIKSQFILNIVVFAIAILVVSVSLVVENRQLSDLNNQAQSANKIQTGVNDLGSLTDNFFLYQEDAKLLEWKTTFTSLYNEVLKLNSTNPQQQTYVNNIKKDLEDISLSYNDLVIFLWDSPRNVSVRVTPEFQKAWNQTSEQYQALNNDSDLLITFIADQAAQSRSTITALILVIFSLFGAYFLTNYFVTYHRTIKSILGLKAVTAIVGSGNFDYQIKVNQKDEIGELAVAFNQMTSHLKSVTASKIELDKEISERKNVELKLNRTMEKLISVNEKLRVVGNLTRHDVRNKLTAVTGYAYLLKKKHAEQPDVVEGLGKMEQAVRDSMRIFDFAKMYEQIGVEELTYIDAEKKLKEAAVLFSELTPTIINDCYGLTVLADSFLRQLFYNFIDNTIKYGQKTTAIRVYYTKNDEDNLKLIYEDDGVGVSLENKSKLFKEGFSTGGSTGFGLFLTKKMIDVYGWSIVEEGEPGKGVKFVMNIPRLNNNGKENYQIVA